MNGFYIAYLAGPAGNGVVLFAIKDRILTGVDSGGIKYDGDIVQTDTGYHCTLVYLVPAGAVLITGSPPASSPQRIPLEFDLPRVFTEGQIIRIVTPLGPLNAKFEKLRDF